MNFIFNNEQQQFLRDAIGGRIALVNIANMASVTNMYSTEMMHDILAAIPDSDTRRHVARMIAPSFNKMVRQLCRTHACDICTLRCALAAEGYGRLNQWQPLGPNSMEAFIEEALSQIDRKEDDTPWQQTL